MLVILSTFCLIALCVLTGAVNDFSRKLVDNSPREMLLYTVGDGGEKIAVLTISGVLVDGNDSAERQLKAIRADASIRAVVVRIDSPGGTVSASDKIHRELLPPYATATHPRYPDQLPKPLVTLVRADRGLRAAIMSAWPEKRSSRSRPRSRARSVCSSPCPTRKNWPTKSA